MEQRKLEVIRYYLTKRNNKDEKLSMDSIDEIDLIDNIFHNFVKFIDEYPVDEQNKRIVQLGKNKESETYFKRKSSKRAITGILETGKYGKEEDVVDVLKKDDDPVFKIHKNHAVPKPFFFLLCVPNLKKEGVIILEKDGQFGIKSTFTKVLKKYLNEHFPNVSIHFYNFIDDQIVKNYVTKGDLKSIKLTRESLPVDVAERYGIEKFETNDFVLELTIKTKGRKLITGNPRKKILELFESNPDGFFHTEEFSKLGFDEKSKIKVSSTYNNSPRTIDLSDTMKFRPYYDIMVDLNNSGHSEFNSIESESIELLDNLNLDLY